MNLIILTIPEPLIMSEVQFRTLEKIGSHYFHLSHYYPSVDEH
jgi:hypothetical protein